MSEIAGAISAAIEEQSAATREIAGSIHEAASGTTQASEGITSVRAASNDNGNKATLMLNTAVTLSSEAERLSQRVEEFVAAVRVA
jgi:methyl-accepting chemotaxis protein